MYLKKEGQVCPAMRKFNTWIHTTKLLKEVIHITEMYTQLEFVKNKIL